MPAPGFLVASTHSGGGKTTATTVLCAALRDRGLRVQPFKVGPDFIDPAYHAEATGRRSINLDVWMMGEEGVRRSFARWSGDADVAVVESMGALYDGADGTGHGSPAHVAKLLGLPVVLVLDVSGMTRTTGAILQGLLAFDPEVEVAGVVLSRVGSARHAEMVVGALPDGLRGLVLGAIPRDAGLEIPERHLGLLTAEENAGTRAERAAARARAARGLDVERLVPATGRRRRPAAPPAAPAAPAAPPAPRPVARLAVARDAAFCFAYEENLLLLRDAGFELVPFRPTADPALPPGVDAVHLGGGYPESFTAQLAANRSLAAELRERAAAGMPIYAECGGLVYLARSLTGFDGETHPMAGILPLDVMMDPAYLAIRYVEARTTTRSPLGPAGTVARGQEFHQSRIVRADLEPVLYDVTASDGRADRGGFLHGSVVASYVHLHLASNPALAASLVRSAVQARA